MVLRRAFLFTLWISVARRGRMQKLMKFDDREEYG